MSEQDGSTSKMDWTLTALGFTHACYAGALLAARHQPEDQHRHRQQRATEAQDEYREAARKAGLSSGLLPGDFAHEQD